MTRDTKKTVIMAVVCGLVGSSVWLIDTLVLNFLTVVVHWLAKVHWAFGLITVIAVLACFWCIIKSLRFSAFVWKSFEWRIWVGPYGFATAVAFLVTILWGHVTFLDITDSKIVAWVWEILWLLIFAISPIGSLLFLGWFAIRGKPFFPVTSMWA